MANVKVIDKGFDAFERNAKLLKGLGVKVGIQAGSGEVLEYAAYNEFGTRNIPSRPFIRQTADTKRPQIAQAQARIYDQVINGASAKGGMAKLGEWYQGILRANVLNGGWTPNAASTVAKKGSSRPLVDHGVLVNSIRWAHE